MKQFTEKIVTKGLQKLRMITLVTLCATAVGLACEPYTAVVQTVETDELAGMTVAVDPGHGGYDGGARAAESGIWEKEIALQIAREVARELEARGAAAVLTRDRDVCLAEEGSGKARKRADLEKRLEIARQAGADVFLSVHLNEYRDRSESGPQVFYQKGQDAGRLLAGAVQESLVKTLQPGRIREANAGDYYVLRNAVMPAVLVECGFLSNAEEEKELLDGAYQRRVAQAVADGLANWRRLCGRMGENGR